MSVQATLTPQGAYQLQLRVDVFERLAGAVDTLQTEASVAPPPSAGSSGFEPVHFSRVRCSV